MIFLKKVSGSAVEKTKEYLQEKKVSCSKTMVCRAFGINPKSIYKNPKTQQGGTVLKFYNKKEDCDILSQIKAVIKIRPTYGHKRVTAMVNSKRNAISLGKINKKRIFRVMKKNGLMLPKTEKIWKGTKGPY
jgi:hypothetical protein